ncbi:MAG: ADP-ribosylglycohydrolase family protein [Ferruginibacter sp.]
MKNLLRDTFLGIAIGDAFGAGLEFQDRHWIRANIDFTKFINRRSDINTPKKAAFLIDYKEWDYTDDTEMSIAVTKAMMSNEDFSEELLVKYFLQEYNQGFDTKGYKRNGHGAIKAFFNGEKTIEEIRKFQQDRKYPGNAPPMRAIPIGFATADKIHLWATINANATHPHPKAIASSILIARAAEGLLLKKINQEDIIPYCMSFIEEKETLSLLSRADCLPVYDALTAEDFFILCGEQPMNETGFLTGVYGLPSNAMFTAVTALYILKHSYSAFDALRYSVYTGGDVDSLAAICVGITAGKYGINSIPAFMITSVEGRAYLDEIADQFDKFLKNENREI